MSVAPSFTVYSIGLCSASVCTSLSIEEATKRLNIDQPTGIKSQWVADLSETFKTGEKNGCNCEQNPKTHRHFLFHC